MSWLQILTLATAGFLAALPAVAASSPAPTNTLEWRAEQNKVTADIKGWDVRTLLEHVAASTGWDVFLEPGTKYTVSAKFRDRAPGEALRLLIPPLTAVLLPQSNAPPKLCVYKTSVQDATQRIAPISRSKRGPISNELIVKLKPGEKIDELARRLGAKVVGKIDGLNAYRLRFDNADSATSAREALQGDSSVDSVDYNYPIMRPPDPEPISLSSTPPMNLRPQAATAGDQIIVGLIDSAVQKLGNGLDDFLLPGISVVDGADASGKPRHGDSMFQTILKGIEAAQQGADGSKVRVLPVDVYGASEMTSTFDISAGIFRAVESGAKIINLSLGSPVDTPFLATLIENSAGQGVLFFAAAGNEPVTTPMYPAAYPDVIAVTAITRDGGIAPWANYGSFVDIGAPGSSLVSFGGMNYLVTGTSTSTALSAGGAAAIAQFTGKAGTQLSTIVRQTLAIPAKK